MKRDRFTSEYDRVRKDAEYSRLHVKGSEFYDVPVDAQGRTVEDRVEAMRLEVHESINLARAAEQEAERAAGITQRHDQFRADVDRAIMLSEYQRLGLTPPTPLCSLGLLISIGWTIEQFGDRNVLMRPVAESGSPRKRREDYEQTEGT